MPHERRKESPMTHVAKSVDLNGFDLAHLAKEANPLEPGDELERATCMPDGSLRQCAECDDDLRPGHVVVRNPHGRMMHLVCPSKQGSGASSASARPLSAQSKPQSFEEALGRSLLEGAGSRYQSHVPRASRDVGDLVAEAMGLPPPTTSK